MFQKIINNKHEDGDDKEGDEHYLPFLSFSSHIQLIDFLSQLVNLLVIQLS